MGTPQARTGDSNPAPPIRGTRSAQPERVHYAGDSELSGLLVAAVAAARHGRRVHARQGVPPPHARLARARPPAATSRGSRPQPPSLAEPPRHWKPPNQPEGWCSQRRRQGRRKECDGRGYTPGRSSAGLGATWGCCLSNAPGRHARVTVGLLELAEDLSEQRESAVGSLEKGSTSSSEDSERAQMGRVARGRWPVPCDPEISAQRPADPDSEATIINDGQYSDPDIFAAPRHHARVDTFRLPAHSGDGKDRSESALVRVAS
jgi:hypothetical protein